MWKTLTFLFGGMLIGVMILFGYFFIHGIYSQSTDHRRLIALSAVEKDMVLGEMRTMLKSVNGIIDALSKNDMKMAAESASASGMKMAVDVDPILMAKLPFDFKELGMGTHALFDELTKQIESGAKPEEVLKKLSVITNRCVACHDVNRFGSIKGKNISIEPIFQSDKSLAKRIAMLQ